MGGYHNETRDSNPDTYEGHQTDNWDQTDWYTKDLFGLKTLDERNAIDHCDYHDLRHDEVIDDYRVYIYCVRPYLGTGWCHHGPIDGWKDGFTTEYPVPGWSFGFNSIKPNARVQPNI